MSVHAILSKGFISKHMKEDAHFQSFTQTQSKLGMSLQNSFRVAEQRIRKRIGKMIKLY